LFGSLPTDHAEELGHVGKVGRLLVGELGRDVVVAVEAETALGDRDRILVGHLVVRADPHAEHRTEERSATHTHEVGEFFARICGADLLEERGDRLRVERLDARLTHEGRIEGSDLGRVQARRGIDALLATLKDFPDAGLGADGQLRENAIGTAIGRNDGAVIPGAIAVAEKVVAGPGRKIHARKIKSPGTGRSRSGARRLPVGTAAPCDGEEEEEKPRDEADRFRHSFGPLGGGYILSLRARRVTCARAVFAQDNRAREPFQASRRRPLDPLAGRGGID
jgi:hypothetical protein